MQISKHLSGAPKRGPPKESSICPLRLECGALTFLLALSAPARERLHPTSLHIVSVRPSGSERRASSDRRAAADSKQATATEQQAQAPGERTTNFLPLPFVSGAFQVPFLLRLPPSLLTISIYLCIMHYYCPFLACSTRARLARASK
eukprot:scaffold9380_cov111-Isochrysis_galbana.AAC.5